jgi:hypothetical protein
VAGDDAVEIWLNGRKLKPISWHGNEQPWIFQLGQWTGQRRCHLHYRGYRQVILKEGLNEVLLRVENRLGGVGMSLHVSAPKKD